MRLLGHRVTAAAFLAFVLAACQPQPPFKATELKGGVEWGKDFVLTAHSGGKFNTATLHGKVVVLFFGYAHCPDICAPTLARLAQAMRQLGDDAAQVQVLFVTVDPKHDTAEKLAAFVPKFHPSFIGLTGSEAEIRTVAADYKAAYQPNPASTEAQPRVDHFGGIMVKDRAGRLRLLMRGDTAVEDITADLRVLAREAASATSR